MEQLDYNLLFRWFVRLGVDDPVWVPTVLGHREVKPLLSNDHVPADGTLVEAWASLKSFRAKDGSDQPPSPGRNGERDFHGEKRRNDTHASTTDPDAKLYRKSSNTAAKLSYIGDALAENRHGLIVEAGATQLRPQDWKSGDRLWVVEVIAPFGGAEEMIRDLKAKVFPDREVKFAARGAGGKMEVRIV